MKPRRPAVLILTPTRELAVQVAQAIASYSRFCPDRLKVVALVGGASVSSQMQTLNRGVTVAVATPGRLQDLLERGAIGFDDVTTLVLDEADKMLDLGFADAIELLLSKVPEKRQTILLSATFPPRIGDMTKRILSDPVIIAIDDQEEAFLAIVQRVIEVNPENRGPLLRHLLNDENWRSVLVFVGSQKAAVNITAKLVRDGVSAGLFHGDLPQTARTSVLEAFKNHELKVLVATDLASRGIDISSLSHVVNYDLPRSPADYIHRIGRTGRAGENGVAVSFIGHDDQAHFKLIEKRMGVRLQREQLPGFELTGDPAPKKGESPVKGKRPNKKEKARNSSPRKWNGDNQS